MKNTLVLFGLLFAMLFATQSWGQKYFTRYGQITFTSKTPIEDIEAVNKKVASVWDVESGKMEFAVLVKAFLFEKALMQEHFNENYLESSKFPKATFKGTISNREEVNLSEDGTYVIRVKGDMTIHGVTQPVFAEGEVVVKEGVVSARSTFSLAPEDYEIAIPAMVRDNIAKSVEVDIKLDYELLPGGS